MILPLTSLELRKHHVADGRADLIGRYPNGWIDIDRVRVLSGVVHYATKYVVINGEKIESPQLDTAQLSLGMAA